MLPEGLKILKYAEVEDGLNLAKLIDAAVYRISGEGAPLDGRAAQVLSDEAARLNALFACSFAEGTVTLTVGDLEHCGAGLLVKALAAAGVVSGWQDLRMERLTVGKWNAEAGAVLPLI